MLFIACCIGYGTAVTMRWFIRSNRRAIIAAACVLTTVAGVLAITAPALASDGKCARVSDDAFNACVIYSGDLLWAKATTPQAWFTTEAILEAQVVRCQSGRCWVDVMTVFDTDLIGNITVTPSANWRYGRDHYGVIGYRATVVARAWAGSATMPGPWFSTQYLN
jgi:hypothetical protein